jgi:glycosyltransferase involved in cell wall biosynthesis
VNILHIEDERWDSGIAHYAVTLAAEQACRGHKVAVWGLKESPVLAQASKAGLPTRGWAEGPLGWAEIPALRREMAVFAPRIVNAHTGSSHALALMAVPRGARVIRTRGDSRPVQATSLTRWSAGRTAAFIAANSTIEAQLKAAFPQTPVRLVPQGIDGPEADSPMPGPPFVGMIARLDAVKGHAVLFDAAGILVRQVKGLLVLCAGSGQLLDRLRWQIKPMGLDGTVRLLGRVEDKWPFLSGCRLGVVASVGSEAVSRAALEWMAAGRPLVATRVGGLADLVEDGVTGLLVPPNDPVALAAAIQKLLDAPPLAEEMGRAARERWEDKFSLAPFYRRTQDVYEAIDALSR